MATATSHFERVAAVGFDPQAVAREQVTECPLCESEFSTQCASHDRYGFNFPARICVNCGFMYLGERLTKDGYGEFYAKWYRPLVKAYSGLDFGSPSVDAGDRGYASVLCNFAADFAGKPFRRTALDIGGSRGLLADELSGRWGYEVTVLDPSPAEVGEAAESGYETVHGLAEDWSTDRKFDLITMLQTVDHLLDPRKVFENARQWLSPYGVFLVDFVDFTVFGRAHGLQSAVKVDHPMYFTAATAEWLLERTGFEVLKAALTSDRRHLCYVCRPVPPNKNTPVNAAYCEQAIAEWVPCQ
jgi:2-polyprenyl-3-methyl-5-hydroxy-6-metoxy-1,4-benzoquinol methylase